MLMKSETREHDHAIETLRAFIAAQNFAPGDRIPPERDLIVDLGISRSKLRKALGVLEREGAIWRHVGKGTFIAHERSQNLFEDLTGLAQQITPVRMMRARLCVESAIAREAAVNASREAIQQITSAKSGAEHAATWADYEAYDDQFHKAVADATDNLLLTTLFDQLNEVRRAVGWVKLVRQTEKPDRSHTSFAEHEKILEAISAHDPNAAYEAMRGHINSVSARLFNEI